MPRFKKLAGSNSGSLFEWIVDRAGLKEVPFYRVPFHYLSIDMWLGALVAASMAWLFISGLLLLLYYNPQKPYESTMNIVNNVAFGKVLLSTHLYAAFTMILTMYIHFFKNYFEGAYKKPRELVWLVGILLLLTTLQTAFFGYVLVGDIVGTDAINVAKGVINGIFGLNLGTLISNMLLGTNPEETYTRALGFHVLFAGLLALLFMLHFSLFEAHGPTPHHKDTKWGTKPEKIDQKRKDLVPWFPINFLYMIGIILMLWSAIFIAVAVAMTQENIHPLINPLPGPPPDSPEAAEHPPYPPWFFLFFYKIADFVFLSINKPIDLGIITIPATPILLQAILTLFLPGIVLVLLPFIDKSDSRHPLKRPWITAFGALMIIYLVQTTIWGLLTPGQPVRIGQAILVMLPPLIILVIGIHMLKKGISRAEAGGQFASLLKRGSAAATAGLVMLFINSAFVFAQSVAGEGASAATRALEAALGIGGSVIALLFVAYLAKLKKELKELEQEGKAEQTQENLQQEAQTPESVESETGWLSVLALFYVILILYSLYNVVTIADPITGAANVLSYLAVMLASLYGLIMIIFRVMTEKYKPIIGDFGDIKPHLLAAAILLLAAYVNIA